MSQVTRLRSLLKCKHTILSAPMAGASGARLATAVTEAGGLGFLQSGYGDLKPLEQELTLWHQLQRDTYKRPVPIGMGFIQWSLDKHPALLDTVLRHHSPQTPIAAVILGFGDAANTAHTFKRLGIPVLYQCQTVAQAVSAASYSDAIIAQGNESGGHGQDNLSTLSLVPAVISAMNDVARQTARPPLPVMAAGGIATGADIAATLALGAAGVSIGTRFCLTPECVLPDAIKQRMLRATGADTVRSTVMDIVRFPWPDGYDGRCLREPVITRWHGKEQALRSDAALLAREQKQFQAEGGRFVWCGSGIDKCPRQLAPAASIVAELVAHTNTALANAAALKPF